MAVDHCSQNRPESHQARGACIPGWEVRMSIIIRIFGLEVLHIHLDQLEPADTSPGDAVSNPVGFVLPMHEVDMPDREL